MSGNLEEAISIDEAVSLMVDAPGTASEEAEDVTDEVDTEEAETLESEADDGHTEDSDEDDTETDEIDEEDNDDDTEEEGDDGDPVFEIETDDGTLEVPLDDLVQSYQTAKSLQADYTRKSMANADTKRELAERDQQTGQIQQQLTDALAYWAVQTEAEPNWAELATTVTPQDFNLKRVEWEDSQKKRQDAAQQYQALQEHQRAEALRNNEAQIMDAFPEWREPERGKKEIKTLLDTAEQYGFSAEEVVYNLDPRTAKLLIDARKYRELQKAKPKVTRKVNKAPKKLKPSAKPTKAQSSKVARQKQLDRFAKSGRSVDDALDLLFK